MVKSCLFLFWIFNPIETYKRQKSAINWHVGDGVGEESAKRDGKAERLTRMFPFPF